MGSVANFDFVEFKVTEVRPKQQRQINFGQTSSVKWDHFFQHSVFVLCESCALIHSQQLFAVHYEILETRGNILFVA